MRFFNGIEWIYKRIKMATDVYQWGATVFALIGGSVAIIFAFVSDAAQQVWALSWPVLSLFIFLFVFWISWAIRALIVWLKSRKKYISNTESLSVPSANSPQSFAEAMYIYRGAADNSPRIEIKFARSFAGGELCVDCSHFPRSIGTGQKWSQRQRVMIAKVVPHSRLTTATFALFVKVSAASESDAWDGIGWASSGSEVLPIPVLPTWYRCRAVLIGPNGTEEYAYFLAERAPDGDVHKWPVVVWRGSFDYADEWEKEERPLLAAN